MADALRDEHRKLKLQRHATPSRKVWKSIKATAELNDKSVQLLKRGNFIYLFSFFLFELSDCWKHIERK